VTMWCVFLYFPFHNSTIKYIVTLGWSVLLGFSAFCIAIYIQKCLWSCGNVCAKLNDKTSQVPIGTTLLIYYVGYLVP